MFLTTWTRPDLAFATNQLAKYMSDPHEKHMLAAIKVLRYLKGTKYLGITYTRNLNDPNRLLAFADADWASWPRLSHTHHQGSSKGENHKPVHFPSKPKAEVLSTTSTH